MLPLSKQNIKDSALLRYDSTSLGYVVLKFWQISYLVMQFHIPGRQSPQ